MKEIDFLPDWYKNGQKRRFSYRTQYLALSGILLVMIVWHVLALYSISFSRVQIENSIPEIEKAENTSYQLAELQKQISLLYQKQNIIQITDSRINISNILAEISYLVNDKIVLTKLDITSEKFVQQQKTSPGQVAAVVKAVQTEYNNKQVVVGDVKFKIVIAGVAADAAYVADLIQKLEESPYFSSIVLSYSRNANIQTQNNVSASVQNSDDSLTVANSQQQPEARSIQVSRFEISCYLANYLEN